MKKEPLVSIGIPVYNEALHLRRSLDSWLAQDYLDFELIITDNASTDGTLDICREYAARDPRIRLIENSNNIGIFRNHQLVFELSRGRYFTWAGGHDCVNSSFISKTLHIMENNESVVLCTCRSEFRDEQDVCWRVSKGGLDTRGLPPHERFARMIQHATSGGTANLFYGLYKQDVLSQFLEFKKTIGTDVILLSQIALLGDVVQLDDVLYYRFVPQKREGKKRLKRIVEMLFGDPGFEPNALMPYLGMLFGYIQVLEGSKLSVSDRQFMFQVVMEESRRLRAVLDAEFAAFVETAAGELQSLDGFAEVRRYRATQILDGLNRALMFGIASKESRHLQDLCEKILGGMQGAISRPQSRTYGAFLARLVNYKYKLKKRLLRSE